MPGWPANKLTEPSRIPPPRTLSKSEKPVESLLPASEGSIVSIETASRFLPETAPRASAPLTSDSGCRTCSRRVFHSPQFSQRPAHFAKFAPLLSLERSKSFHLFVWLKLLEYPSLSCNSFINILQSLRHLPIIQTISDNFCSTISLAFHVHSLL